MRFCWRVCFIWCFLGFLREVIVVLFLLLLVRSAWFLLLLLQLDSWLGGSSWCLIEILLIARLLSIWGFLAVVRASCILLGWVVFMVVGQVLLCLGYFLDVLRVGLEIMPPCWSSGAEIFVVLFILDVRGLGAARFGVRMAGTSLSSSRRGQCVNVINQRILS